MSEQPESKPTEIKIHTDTYGIVTYRLVDYVGRGELGAVYKGTAENGQEVVVKVPHNLSKNRQAEEEYAILTAIAEQFQKTDKVEPLGAIARVEHDEKTLIVMPYYENTDRLLDVVKQLLNTGETLKAERIAVDAAVHYTQVMQAIHSIPESKNEYINGPRSCTDRKIKDYYVVRGQHYILDWNVLREDAEPFRVTEIKLFGFLWHELFFGGKGKAPFDPFDDRKWTLPNAPQGAISVGLRVLMARAVACDSAPAASGADIARLGDALTLWRDLLTQRTPASETAITAMLNAFDGNPLARAEVVTAILNDLKWRLGQSSDLNTRAESLNIARKSLQLGDAWLNDILDLLERSGAQMQLPSAPNSETLTSVHVARWDKLIALLKEAEALVESGDMRFFQRDEVRQAVTTIGRLLHRNPSEDDAESLDEVAQALAKIRENMPNESANRQDIVHEWDARQAALPFNSETRWRLADRIEAVNGLASKFTGYFAPLLNIITEETLVTTFKEKVERVNSGAGTLDEANKAYYELQAWADVIGEGRLLREQIAPWLEVLDFHRTYRQETVTHDLNTLKDVLHRWQLMQSAEYKDFRERLDGVVQLYVDAAGKYLKDNIGKRTMLEVVNMTAALLDAALLEKHKERFGVDEDLITRCDAANVFFKEWDEQSLKLISTRSTSDARTLLDMLSKRPKKDIPMSELFTSQDLIDEYSKLLDAALKLSVADAVKADIDEARAQLRAIKQSVKVLPQDLTDAQNTLKTPQGDYNTLDAQVSTINRTLAPLQQAVDRFTTEYSNITVLTKRVEDLETNSATKTELATKADSATVAPMRELQNTNTNVREINTALGLYFDHGCNRISKELEKMADGPLDVNDLLQIAEEHISLFKIIPITKFDDDRLKTWKRILESIKNLADDNTKTKFDVALKMAEEKNGKYKMFTDSKNQS